MTPHTPFAKPKSALRRSFAALLLLALPVACSAAMTQPPPEVPPTRWDHRPEALHWTVSTMQVLETDAAEMLEIVPSDIGAFCPGYEAADNEERAAFWVALFSGLARYESTWNPQAAGGGGRYRGLLQISPATARYRGCEMDSPADLYDGATNLACAVRIASAAVLRDGVVVGGPGNWGGVAADWPPMRDPAKRDEIAAFTRAQSYCGG